MKETILITGGFGFIGTNLIHRLLQKTTYHILILDKMGDRRKESILLGDKKKLDRLHVIKGSITNKQIVEAAVKQSQSIIHLAGKINIGENKTEITPAVMTNIVGTTLFLDAITKFGIKKFIILSSSGVYGNKVKNIPMDEHHPLMPITPYAASKLSADLLSLILARSRHMPITILRPFNIYGPYQKLEQMVPLFITRLLKGLPIFLNHAGKQSRDWIFIEDVVDSLELLLNAPQHTIAGEIFNLSCGRATQVVTVAKMILDELTMPESYIKLSSSTVPETLKSIGNAEKIKKTIGWKPQTNLKTGIAKTVSWYKNNQHWWEKYYQNKR